MKIPACKKVFYYIILGILLLWIIIPLIWVIFLTFKDRRAFFLDPLGIPKNFDFANYRAAMKTVNIGRGYLNSLILTFGSMALTMLISIPASFALSRFDFKARNFIYTAFSMGVVIPIFTAIYPTYLISLFGGIVNTRISVILPMTAFMLPTSLILMVGYFKTIPKELEEAVVIDGGGVWTLLFRIFLPLCLPIISTAGTFMFLGGWNDFAMPYVLLNKDRLKPLTVLMTFFQGQYGTNYPAMAAGLVLSMLPVLVVYAIFQRYVIEGMTAGAIKG
jgi:raffinose/stachyose/melibiose transport system permease protein